jgi:nicotinamide-nucleotide amidase
MMDFEAKVISREISEILWEMEKTVSTAESCTGGRIAEAIIAVPGASKYFKGGIISYVNEIKESMLGVDPKVLEEQTAVCEEVAREMVIGACKAMNTDYAISATGIAGPT